MSSLVRTLLLWLLVLAVPTQAAAAVTMAFCGPNHHDRGVAALVHQPAAAEHAHRGDVVPDHAHGQAATQPDDDRSVLSDAPSPVKGADASSHKCSACASCCSAAAIFNTVRAVPAPSVDFTAFPVFSQSVEPFAAAGPDRPPRVVLV